MSHHLTRRILAATLGTLALGAIAFTPSQAFGAAPAAAPTATPDESWRPCYEIHQKMRTSVDRTLADIDQALRSNDRVKMRAALENTRQSLMTLRSNMDACQKMMRGGKGPMGRGMMAPGRGMMPSSQGNCGCGPSCNCSPSCECPPASAKP